LQNEKSGGQMTQEYKAMIGLNVYLEPQFRKDVVEKVYSNISVLSDDLRHELIKITKEEINVSGFRNPMLAPNALLVKSAVVKFEKESKFVKLIMQAWSFLYKEFHSGLIDTLKTLGFEISETGPDYTDPENAFMVGWPEPVDYEKLHEACHQDPKNTLNSDENALLSIWLSGILP